MIPEEFFKKIHKIEIRIKKLVNTMFAGEYKSTFKGTGIEFLDVREYLPGDDVRTIDWKVTARFANPYVKKFSEERELTVILMVDASGSEHFGTKNQFKIETAAEIAATLAFSAIRNNDKVGLLFFTDEVERYIPPQKGRSHVLRIIRDILYFTPKNSGTNPVGAIQFLMHILKHRAIIFLITDFIGDKFSPDEIRIPLGVAAQRHDLVVITIKDPIEQRLPKMGLVDLEDLETGEVLTIDTNDKNLLDSFRANKIEEQDNIERLLNSLNIDYIDILTAEDFTPKLHKFFQKRARRMR